MNVSLVVNPVAGNHASRSLDRIKSLLHKKTSLSTFITEKKGDAHEFAKGLKKTDRIVVAGGDGTINEVINGLLSSQQPGTKKIPLSIIPIGTANVLAKELGIPEDIDGAVHVLLSGSAKKISLGRINGSYFALMAGIGFDGETVLGVNNDFIKKISGKLAHIISGFKVLMGYNPAQIKLVTPDKELQGYTAIIGNAKCYGGFFYVTPGASVTDDHLDICVYQGRTRMALIRFIIGVLRQNHLDFKDVDYLKASEMEILSDSRVHVQIDGEYFGTLPVKIEVVRDAINIVW